MIEKSQAENFYQTIEKSKKIAILAHKHPDGDTLGSLLALKHFIEKHFEKEVVCVCKDPISKSFSFLPGIECLVADFDHRDVELIIVVDCGAVKLTNFTESKPEIFHFS